MKCPGQDWRYWKPGDIFNAKCPECGGNVEFFKDEVRRKCRCGHLLTNPKLDFGCAAWCPYAEQCIGTVPSEVRERQKTEQETSLKERISLEMKKFFGKDLKRVNHAVKVARYAEQIVKIEGGNPLVILGAAYLHDIGAPRAEARSEEWKGDRDLYLQAQESEGVPIAKEILQRLNLKEEEIDEICDLIGHHHHPRERETLNFQILYEADWLVHIEEKEIFRDRKAVEAILERSIRTESGRHLVEKLYLLE